VKYWSDYGKDYWKVIRQNIKLRKQEEKEAKQKRNGTVLRKNGVKHQVHATAKRMTHNS
jgi:hypothetical protein